MNFKMRSYWEGNCTHWASVGFLSSLLYFGLGCERHSSKFCENLAAVDWCFQLLCFTSRVMDRLEENFKNFPKVRSEASLPFIMKVRVQNRGQGQNHKVIFPYIVSQVFKAYFSPKSSPITGALAETILYLESESYNLESESGKPTYNWHTGSNHTLSKLARPWDIVLNY